MTQKILISIMNMAGKTRPSTLLLFDPESIDAKWIPVGSDGPFASGIGIWVDDDRVFHTWVADDGRFSSWLTVFDRDTFAIRHMQPLPDITDGHSIVRIGDDLVIASTGTDEIVSYRLEGDRAVDPKVVWTPTGSGSDTHHVNSLLYLDGQLFCSAFGPRESAQYTWASALNGYAYNVTTGEKIVEGLHQPHTLAFPDGQFWWCQSPAGKISNQGGTVAWLAGYSRGLAFDTDGTWYSGTSLGRRRSRARASAKAGSDAAFHNLHDKDRRMITGRCAVIRFGADEARTEFSLAQWADEIYDVVLMG